MFDGKVCMSAYNCTIQSVITSQSDWELQIIIFSQEYVMTIIESSHCHADMWILYIGYNTFHKILTADRIDDANICTIDASLARDGGVLEFRHKIHIYLVVRSGVNNITLHSIVLQRQPVALQSTQYGKYAFPAFKLKLVCYDFTLAWCRSRHDNTCGIYAI